MPSISVHLPQPSAPTTPNPLPNLLHTPSGLAIVEIQGTIHAPDVDESADPSQNIVGKLVFPFYDASLPPEDTAWMKRVYLYVGKHQRMTGEVKKLAKPLAVIRRRDISNGAENPSAGDDGELEIAEIVYYKILFAHRPEPVGVE